MSTRQVDAGGVTSAPSVRVTQPRTSGKRSQGFAHCSTKKTARCTQPRTFRASRFLIHVLYWVAAFLGIFGVLIIADQPLTGVLALIAAAALLALPNEVA